LHCRTGAWLSALQNWSLVICFNAREAQSGGQFFGIHASSGGRMMIFAGEIPLKQNGKVVGAVVVSGDSGEQDHAVAEAGAMAL
jgi:uncharacterized protein GlcG (DUF336 family)